MKLSLWSFPRDKQVRTFCICGVVMGNKPSTNLTMVALLEAAKQEDISGKYPFPKEMTLSNTYMDNIFIVASDSKLLYLDIKVIEAVCKQGCFSFPEWIISSQYVPKTVIGVKLPNQIRADKQNVLELILMSKMICCLSNTILTTLVRNQRRIKPLW